MRKPLKLNLGCGSNKIDGFVNVDVEPNCKPDVICNFIHEPLPYKKNSVDEVVLFHCIEHISKIFHPHILDEIWRVLKPSGQFIVSYPEFLKCVDNWKKNHRGKKEFWEATIYGLQRYASDFHVCIMHTPQFVEVLKSHGFDIADSKPEPQEAYNSIVYAIKGTKPINYEEVVGQYKEKYMILKRK